ncbi:tRNA (adenine-N(1))-methyltransferase, partial [Pseudomonas sp. MWU13-2625]
MPGIARQNRPPIRHKVPELGGEKGQQLNQQTLSMRLARVAAHVPTGARLADIGAEPGYL